MARHKPNISQKMIFVWYFLLAVASTMAFHKGPKRSFGSTYKPFNPSLGSHLSEAQDMEIGASNYAHVQFKTTSLAYDQPNITNGFQLVRDNLAAAVVEYSNTAIIGNEGIKICLRPDYESFDNYELYIYESTVTLRRLTGEGSYSLKEHRKLATARHSFTYKRGSRPMTVWVTFDKLTGKFRFGAGSVFGKKPLLEWTDDNPMDINHISFHIKLRLP